MFEGTEDGRQETEEKYEVRKLKLKAERVGCRMSDVFLPSLRSATGGVAVPKFGETVAVNSLPAEGRSQLDVGCQMLDVRFLKGRKTGDRRRKARQKYEACLQKVGQKTERVDISDVGCWMSGVGGGFGIKGTL